MVRRGMGEETDGWVDGWVERWMSGVTNARRDG